MMGSHVHLALRVYPESAVDDAQIRERAIAAMMQRIGLRARPREAGSYVLDKKHQLSFRDSANWRKDFVLD